MEHDFMPPALAGVFLGFLLWMFGILFIGMSFSGDPGMFVFGVANLVVGTVIAGVAIEK